MYIYIYLFILHIYIYIYTFSLLYSFTCKYSFPIFPFFVNKSMKIKMKLLSEITKIELISDVYLKKRFNG